MAVRSLDGAEVDGSVTLPGRIFDVPLRIDIAHRVVRWQRARAQQGTHKTKTRSEVKGSTRKVRAQKGSGRARIGDLRPPHFRGGGVAHGPVVRSHAHDLNKKVRRLGLKVALSAKAAEGRLVVLDTLGNVEPKTKVLDATLDNLLGVSSLAAGGRAHSLLLVDEDHQTDEALSVRLAARNLPHVQVLPECGINVYSILQHRSLGITRGALDRLVARLDAPVKR